MIDPNRYDVTTCAIVNSASVGLETKLRSLRNDAAAHEEYAKKCFDTLNTAAKTYHQGGVAMLTNDVIAALYYLEVGVTPREFFQRIATDLGRPLVTAEPDYYSNGIVLTVPKNKAMQNIVAPLLLVIPEDNLNARHRIDGPIRSESTTRWKFFFPNDNKDQFKQWCEMCRTNPVARIVLKIPR